MRVVGSRLTGVGGRTGGAVGSTAPRRVVSRVEHARATGPLLAPATPASMASARNENGP